MSYVDLKNFDKLSPEQKAKYENMLKNFPALQNKYEASRQLNTGTPFTPPPERVASATKQTAADDDSVDFGAVQDAQREYEKKEPVPTNLGDMNIDAENHMFTRSFVKNEELLSDKQKKENELREKVKKTQGAAKFSTKGKVHPVLSRVRNSLGMDSYEKPFVAVVGGVSYELCRLKREEIIQATSLASLKSKGETEIRGNVEVAVIAYAVAKIDGVALSEVFEIPHKDFRYATRRVENLTDSDRHEMAAVAFFDFIKQAPNELTETLVSFYEQQYPPLSLLEKDKTTALCPAENCQHKMIIGKQENRFCPLHGQALVKEDSLENPF